MADHNTDPPSTAPADQVQTPGPARVRVRGLTYRYGARAVLDDVDLTLRAGAVSCLLGPHGAGKTTLLGALVGRPRPQSGAIVIDDLPGGSPAATSRVGYLPQDQPLPTNLTGTEVLRLLTAVHPHWHHDLVADLVELLGLTRALPHPIGQYSRGMRRNLHLVASLGHRPSTWVLDEPLAGLDPPASHITTALIRRFAAAGGATLIATCDLTPIVHLADDVTVLSRGRVVHAGTVSDFVPTTGTLAETYRELTGMTSHLELTREVLGALDLTPEPAEP
jgi:ABC-2 type transport system ATP-binding protein